jgi:large subunit ribosomal protein L21
MFAVIKTGGKQYKLQAGDIFHVEKLAGEAGSVIDFNEVLALGTGAGITIGTPLVKGASVAVQIVDQKKDDKVIIFKKKRRHNYRRKRGHRQEITVVKVLEVLEAGKTRTVQPEALKAKYVNPAQRPKVGKAEKVAQAEAKAKAPAAPKAKKETTAKAAPAKKPAAAKAKKTTKE